MIEQIVNWWNSLPEDVREIIIIIVFVFLYGVVLSFFITIPNRIQNLKNKRKTTTQKFREGLIKK